MGIRTVISCDVCKKDQGEANHWFVTWVSRGVYHSCSIKKQRKGTEGDKYACGTNCETALHNRWMTTGNLDLEMHVSSRARPVGLKVDDNGRIVESGQFSNNEPLQ